MNKKTPNPQTQAAMTEARAMARSRMPAVGVESLPTFTKPARQRWESIPADIRQRLLSNIWCGQCRHETTITQHFDRSALADCGLSRSREYWSPAPSRTP
jgi:hypothetical protein